MEQLRECAKAMFQGGHITKFVYIDDMFGNTLVGRETSKLYVSEHLAEIDFITSPEVWEDQFEDWWRDTSVEERQKRCLSWGLQAENADDLKNKFEQFIPDTIARYYLPPQVFDRDKDSILAELDEDHQLMILVDHKLDNYGRDGEDVLNAISHRAFVNCAIFTGTFPIDEEIDKWNSSQDKANIYKLSKDRLRTNDDAIILEGLRSVLWLKHISKVKEQTKNIIESALSFLSTELDNIDPATFHKVILDRSEKEGCWEFETLMRIVYAYLGMGIKDKMTNDGYNVFQTLTSSLREIKRDASAHGADGRTIQTIIEEETYESSSYINKTYSQISNGDIFKIGKLTREFILLCQPCNLAIRPTGKRKRDNFDQFYLVPIRTLAVGEQKKDFEVELRSTDATQKKVVELANFQRVSLALLDLVSFNEEGKSFIDLKQTIDNHPKRNVIQKNMMIRYGIIWKKVKEYKDKYDIIQASDFEEKDKDTLSKEFCPPFEMGDTMVAKSPQKVDGKSDVFDFKIERVRRYKDPYAKDLLSFFMDYLSRPGYPMEL